MANLRVEFQKNLFVVGDKFSFGGKIYVSNGNGWSEVNPSSATFRPAIGSVLSKIGAQTVYVTVNSSSCTYIIQVSERSIKGGVDIAYGLADGRYSVMNASYASLDASGNKIDEYYLPLSGGTMTGVLNMGGKAIKNVPDPVEDQDVVTKRYAEANWGAEILSIPYSASLPPMNAIQIGKGGQYRLVPQGDTSGAINAFALGYGSVASASGAIAIGHGAVADHIDTVSFDSPDSIKTISVQGPENIFFKKNVEQPLNDSRHFYTNGFNLKQYTDAKRPRIVDTDQGAIWLKDDADLVGEVRSDIISMVYMTIDD